jgi:hypothetical protein
MRKLLLSFCGLASLIAIMGAPALAAPVRVLSKGVFDAPVVPADYYYWHHHHYHHRYWAHHHWRYYG